MARRRVLIVDDSKTAQARLRKMLERFDLEVDTVMSAEEALGYLSYRQPAVIFLDHHMEGMDGLEALKIIKSNPGTALIPVIMYTSEQGDVYVGQARALGAIDILGKEVMKYANLEKVLGSLGISPRGVEEPTAEATEPLLTDAVEEKPLVKPLLTSFDAVEDPEPEAVPHSDLDQVQKQISRLFEIHIAKVRQEIEDSTKFLLRRLAKDAQEKNRATNRAANVTPEKAPEPAVPLEPFVEPPAERSGLSNFFLGIILLGIAFLGYHIYVNNRHQELLASQYEELIKRTRAQEELVNRLLSNVSGDADATGAAAGSFADRQILLDALSWAVNVNTQIAFGEIPLGDQRIYMLGELLALLKAANFNGAVYLDIHLGNFCVVEDPSGRFILPEPESNLDECMFLANRVPEVAVNDQVSVGFLNYLHSAPILLEGNIEVELSSHAYSIPRYTYPAITNAVSAGEWNAIAQKNNRISVSFSAN
ncbi:response regulator [Saccharophagus sp. K07]|uniref:response regulator n=1 Tax=Saccharophagus sp. K07 TaxID=2283636 RepID=UPI001651DF3F|nr:response regulator [Saccharophagus sp. K07]MBC6905597.1 response regulator [Saccharophagus sp. K07]